MASIAQSPGVKKAGRRGNGLLKGPKLVQLGPDYVAKPKSLRRSRGAAMVRGSTKGRA